MKRPENPLPQKVKTMIEKDKERLIRRVVNEKKRRFGGDG